MSNEVPRDYVSDMNDLLRSVCSSEDDVVPSIAAAKLVTKLLEWDSDLLFGWLVERASSIVADQLRFMLRSQRTRARSSHHASVFGKAVSEYENSGDSSLLGRWLETRYVVDSLYTQRRLRDMSRKDLLFVSARYDDSAKSHLMQAAFLAALAERVGDKKVGEVFSEAEIDRMYRSVTEL